MKIEVPQKFEFTVLTYDGLSQIITGDDRALTNRSRMKIQALASNKKLIYTNLLCFISKFKIYCSNIIPFSNDTKDTGSMSFLSLPRLVETVLVVPSLSYLLAFLLSDRDG